MFIRDIIAGANANNRTTISFEIFPPKKNFPLNELLETIESLTQLNPDFISVTYGAGGTTKDRTIEIASIIKENFGIESLAHLTCISSTKDQIQQITKELDRHDIHNILALRGDFPKDPDFKFPTPLHYEYASDLVRELKNRGDYCIGAAFYPEGHIEAPDQAIDFQHVAFKVEQGVDFLISQMFFDNSFLLGSIQKLRQLGVTVPFLAGIMPITNYNQTKHIAELCGCTITPGLSQKLCEGALPVEEQSERGISYAVDQIRGLIPGGPDGIHIYTMNKPQIATQILGQLSDKI